MGADAGRDGRDLGRRAEAGHELTLLNIGGGFPAFYGEVIDAPTEYAARVMAMVEPRFPGARDDHGRARPRPRRRGGRHRLRGDADLAASPTATCTAGSISSIGRFSGLAETEGEAIRYQFATPHDGGATGPCIIAGPSCDSADVLYEKRPMQLPLALAAGDRVLIRNTGAYTSTYSSVCFNGFPPLDVSRSEPGDGGAIRARAAGAVVSGPMWR